MWSCQKDLDNHGNFNKYQVQVQVTPERVCRCVWAGASELLSPELKPVGLCRPMSGGGTWPTVLELAASENQDDGPNFLVVSIIKFVMIKRRCVIRKEVNLLIKIKYILNCLI
jgi:hypothetical protein